MAVKAVVFDAYGTLFDVRSVAASCEATFPSRGDALTGLWRVKQFEYTWLLSLMGGYEDFQSVTGRALRFSCRSLGLSLDKRAEARLMGEYLKLEPFPEVSSALQALSGYRLAMLSNGSPDMLRAVVEHAGLSDVFEQVISVDELRVYKPSPKVYRLACRKLGLRAGDIGFVSSNSFDVVGAKRFGLKVFWVNRSGAPLDELDATPDAVLNSLADLVTAL
ncbi:MAG: haloacid dehalogenase type II [SAR202 cluster bacterium]|nr:haloacid dehalogenase type II [SAR202 cluster bacterium]